MQLVVDDEVVAQGLVRRTWSDDYALTTRINPAVAHYTGQAELAEAIQDGLAAKAAGDDGDRDDQARPGRAARGRDRQRRGDHRLRKVVDIDDADTGTVRLKRTVDKPTRWRSTRLDQDHPGAPSERDLPETGRTDVERRRLLRRLRRCRSAPRRRTPLGRRTARRPPAGAACPARPPPSATPAAPPARPRTRSARTAGPSNPADALFCENCGYDFTTGPLPRPRTPLAPPVGRRGRRGGPPVPRHPASGPTRTGADWVAEVWVDPDWYTAQERPTRARRRARPRSCRSPTERAGRPGLGSRNIHPEIDCAPDYGVTRRHAQLTTDGSAGGSRT